MKKFQLIRSKYFGLVLNASIDSTKPLNKTSNFYSSYKWLLSRSYVKGSLILKVLPCFKFSFLNSFVLTEQYMLLRGIAVMTLANFIASSSLHRSIVSLLLSKWYFYLLFLLRIDDFFNKNNK